MDENGRERGFDIDLEVEQEEVSLCNLGHLTSG
jgi:hypothetical protein